MRFQLQVAEVSKLRKAAERAKKLGEVAAKACAKAEINDSEALSLAGYGEEADVFLQKMTKGEVELGARHCLALATGLRSILADLEKDHKKQEALFVDTVDLDVGASEYRGLLTTVRSGGNAPELALRAAAEDFRDSIPEGGSVTISAGGRDPVAIEGRGKRQATHAD